MLSFYRCPPVGIVIAWHDKCHTDARINYRLSLAEVTDLCRKPESRRCPQCQKHDNEAFATFTQIRLLNYFGNRCMLSTISGLTCSELVLRRAPVRAAFDFFVTRPGRNAHEIGPLRILRSWRSLRAGAKQGSRVIRHIAGEAIQLSASERRRGDLEVLHEEPRGRKSSAVRTSPRLMVQAMKAILCPMGIVPGTASATMTGPQGKDSPSGTLLDIGRKSATA